MDIKSLSTPLSAVRKLQPIHHQSKNGIMIVDDGSNLDSNSSARTSASSSISPPHQKIKANRKASTKPSGGKTLPTPSDSSNYSFSTVCSSTTEMVEPLNMFAMQSLGEPDPSTISRTDLLSAMAFDRTGNILSVGDQGGRVICFSMQPNELGQ